MNITNALEGVGGSEAWGRVLSEDLSARLAGFETGSVLAGYRLGAEVGAGGMAVVFRARDERLGRQVALKILAPALASDSEFRRRFIGESRAAAAVDDPHIIPVYEAGEAEGVLFIAMRFVGSGDLRAVLAREGPLAPERAVEFVSQVASALDAAHRAGLVHRDVKPANILVDTSADRPDYAYLSDFGISKAVMASAGLTGTGQYLGTAVYSAPEQIEGRAVDGRTDQYALACVTYELLTGAVPFERDQVAEVLLAHLSEPPPSLGSRRPGLPGAVDEVLARAMAKVPEKRYGTCQEFADALRAALGGRPYYPRSSATAPIDQRELPDSRPGSDGATLPHPRGPIADRLSTITAWPPRRRLPALAVACAILAAGVIPFVLMSQVKSPSPANTPGPANSANPAISQSYSRVGIDLPFNHSGNPVSSVAFSPSGATLAIADNYLCLWHIPATKCTTTSGFANVNSVAFSPDGKILAVGSATGRIALWNVAARKPTATLADPGSKGVESVAFSPDGKTVAVGDFNGRAYLWDAATGNLAATLSDPGGKGVDSVAFSPDGKTVAAGDSDGSTYLWDVATAKLAGTLPDPSFKGVLSVAFSPGGQTLAAGDGDGSTYLWDVATGNLAATLTDPDSLNIDSVAFSPDGKTLATGDYSGYVYLWHKS